MSMTVAEIMTSDPLFVSEDETVLQAARKMADRDVGAVLVERGGDLCGILTDRDIVVRLIAEGRDPSNTRVGQIASHELVTVSSADPAERAVELIRTRAIRRLPVVDDYQAVGVVSLGDLALDRDRSSALAAVSAAPPNH
jgi:CBS domain-containing protein